VSHTKSPASGTYARATTLHGQRGIPSPPRDADCVA
jgi:hypothetical protein